MDLELVTWDDEPRVAELAELKSAHRAADAPFEHDETVEMVAADLRWGHDGSPSECHLLRDGGRALGWFQLFWFERDNRDLAWTDCGVRPEARGRGVGRTLLGHQEARARELGRTLMGGDAYEGSSGDGFLLAHGYEQKAVSVRRRQHLDRLRDGLVEELTAHAEQRAGDYELVRFDGPLPEEILEDYAAMAGSINDAPLDDLEIEDEVYSGERTRQVEEAQRGRRRDHLRIAARHRDTGALAGHTELVVEGWTPSVAYQLDTAVAPDHRGHRLGLLLKAAMVGWVRERRPEVRTIDTWNAESNRWMIAVNEQLGYEVLARELELQRRLPA